MDRRVSDIRSRRAIIAHSISIEVGERHPLEITTLLLTGGERGGTEVRREGKEEKERR